MASSDALRELLERVERANAPDRNLEKDIAIAVGGWRHQPDAPHNFKWHDGRFDVPGPPPRYTESLDAAVALLRFALPGWWWTIGDCVLTHDAAVAPAGGKSIGLGHALSAMVGPDFRASEEMQTLLRDRPDLDGGVDVARVSGNVALALTEAVLGAKLHLSLPPETSGT